MQRTGNLFVKKQTVLGCVAVLALSAGSAFGQIVRTQGPDVIVGDFDGVTSSTAGGTSGTLWQWDSDGAGPRPRILAYGIGTTSCNIGNTVLDWYTSGTATAENPVNHHPVIGGNVYRYKVITLRDTQNNVLGNAGTFEQIGQSWLKHGFTALQQNACNLGCVPDGLGGVTLDPGCSDPYSASLNASQSRLGPRNQVNAYTGAYPYPVTGIPGVPSQANGGDVWRRLQIEEPDIIASNNVGATYIGEAQYWTQDDQNIFSTVNGQSVNNAWNNASWRRLQFTSNLFMQYGTGSSIQRMQHALFGWKSVDAEVQIVEVDVPNEGRFNLGYRVTDLGNGNWAYEYVVRNHFSDRSAGSFSINIPGRTSCVQVKMNGFRDVFYHSGEPYDGADWAFTNSGSTLSWNTLQTFAQNANANAIRFGTAYTFRVVTNRPPVAGTASIGLFKPGTPSSVNANVMVPGGCPCDLDFNNDTLFPDSTDLDDFIAVLSGGPSACSTGNGLCDSVDFDGDGIFPDSTDLDKFILALGGSCL
jgi:hypothetical protein